MSIDPKTLEALVKASRIDRPKRIEWDLEHFFIESECVSTESEKAREPEKKLVEQADQDLLEFLRVYQTENGISARVLAKQIGISRATLQTFLEAQRSAQPNTIARIRRFKSKAEAGQL